MAESELERVLRNPMGSWEQITAKNAEHFAALPMLLRSAFEKSAHILGQDDASLRVYTDLLHRKERKALEKAGYRIRSCTNNPGP